MILWWWVKGNVDKPRALIYTFLSNLNNQFPQIKDIRYDFNQREFIRVRDARPVDWTKFNEYRGKGSVGVAARAGEATARRGAFIQSLISSESGERSRILEQVLHRASALVKQGMIYHRHFCVYHAN